MSQIQNNYEEYNRAQRWRDDLSRRLAHKAVDIPLGDDMIVQQRYGIGWKELGIVTLLVLAFLAWTMKQEPVKQEPVKQEPVKQEPVKQEPANGYDINFFEVPK